MGPDGKDVLVETGSFTVDRARALEKLMRFALPDPAWAVLSLARVARAGEATRFEAARGARGELTVRFDGDPLPKALLEAPYDALFSRANRREPRGRDLAVALLSMLRLGPSHIVVRAGEGPERAILRLSGASSEQVEASPGAGSETVVHFLPGPRTPAAAWADLEKAFLERAALLRPFPLLDGKQVRPPPSNPEGRPVAGKDLSGWVEAPPAHRTSSVLELYRYGVLIHSVEHALKGPPVVARLDSPAFRMNASQTAVVRDAAFKAAAAAASEAGGALVVAAARIHAERAPQLTQILRAAALFEAFQHEVEDWLSGGSPGLVGSLGRILLGNVGARVDRTLAAEVRTDARRLCWLREAAAPDAPLYLDPFLGWLTRERLTAAADLLGFMPYTVRPGASTATDTVLLLPTAAELAAAPRWFPRVSLVEASTAAFPARSDGRKQSLLARVGVVAAAVRRPLTGGVSGEAALPLQRGDGARIHVFSGGVPVRTLAPKGPLRFVAAVSVTGPVDASRAKAVERAVSAVLEDLYAGAATDWSPGTGSTAAEALEAHLLGALQHWAQSPPAWLESLPLFSAEDGLFDLKGLRARLDAGDTLFFGPSRPVRGAPKLLFQTKELTADALRAVFPDARVNPLPGNERFSAVWRPGTGRRDALGALEDILREHGTHLGGDPQARGHLLDALAETFAPWDRPESGDPRRQRVRDHLNLLPLFNSREEPLTTARVASLVALGRPLSYGPEGRDIVVSDRERAPLERLWPRAQELAVTASPPAPAASGPAPLAFTAPMLVAAKAEAPGLKALIGLPPEPLPGVTVTLELDDGPVDCVLPTPGAAAAGRILLRPEGWKGPLHLRGTLSQPLSLALRELYISFMTRVVEGGLPADPGWERLRPYLLLLAAPARGPAGPWAGLRAKIEDLPLFPTLGGAPTTLAVLRRSAAGGTLRFALPNTPPAPGAEDVPIVANRALVEAVLKAELAEADTAPAVGARPGAPVPERCESLLRRVRGRKGLDPRLTPKRNGLAVAGGAGRRLVDVDEGAWTVDSTHPAARLALDAGLDADTQAVYLLSAAATAVNRQSSAQTDREDALFQSLLAEAAAEDG